MTQELIPPPPEATELAAAVLQGAITAGLAALSAHLYVRYQRPWFGWFALAWSVYVARLLCILSFLLSGERIWLYWHQVTTGWTALALLWASVVFLRQPRWRPWYSALALFPPLWSYIAIYQLDDFLLAALPAVVFLSGATIWTGVVFWRHHRDVTSTGARLLAIAFVAWGLHHLDYPFLRAQGAWNPWGYYLDICFQLLVGAGLVLLVLDDLNRGMRALTELSSDLQRRDRHGDVLDVLLSRPLALPGVRGSALYRFTNDSGAVGQFERAAGSCNAWAGREPSAPVADALARLRTSGRAQVVAATDGQPFVAALPVAIEQRLTGALVMVSDMRNPFTALDDDFLLALGAQVGAALERANLDRQLDARTAALEQLSVRMVRQHEDERRRLSRELHDETAQVFTAVRMQLESLRGALAPTAAPRLDRLSALIDTGIRSIRNVTNDLRPSLLDDLGLLPALRSLASDFSERTGHQVALRAPDTLPPLSPDAELALFRSLQEALSNVARHAGAKHIDIQLGRDTDMLIMQVVDDGVGVSVGENGLPVEAEGRMGLAGMRERLHALGGTVTLLNRGDTPAAASGGTRGTVLRVTLPLT